MIYMPFHGRDALRVSAGLITYAVVDDGSVAPQGAFRNGLPLVDSFAGTALEAHNAGYSLDVSVRLARPVQPALQQRPALSAVPSLADDSDV